MHHIRGAALPSTVKNFQANSREEGLVCLTTLKKRWSPDMVTAAVSKRQQDDVAGDDEHGWVLCTIPDREGSGGCSFPGRWCERGDELWSALQRPCRGPVDELSAAFGFEWGGKAHAAFSTLVIAFHHGCRKAGGSGPCQRQSRDILWRIAASQMSYGEDAIGSHLARALLLLCAMSKRCGMHSVMIWFTKQCCVDTYIMVRDGASKPLTLQLDRAASHSYHVEVG